MGCTASQTVPPPTSDIIPKYFDPIVPVSSQKDRSGSVPTSVSAASVIGARNSSDSPVSVHELPAETYSDTKWRHEEGPLRTLAFRVSLQSPSDMSGLLRLLDGGLVLAEQVLAVLGKTEGNGGRNDFTRELAVTSISTVLGQRLGIPADEVEQRVIMSISGGCEGVASPHLIVLARAGLASESLVRRSEARLAFGIGFTRAFAPEEIGRLAQVEETARVVKQIAQELRLDSMEDVHLVQMKGAIPPSTFEASQRAKASGVPLRNDMVYSRGASALGAAVAIGEVDARLISDDAINHDFSLYSGVASVSAKPGLMRTEIMVLGNSHYWSGGLRIEHSVMHDILDTESIVDTLSRLGITFSGRQPSPEQRERVVAVMAKSEADPRAQVRGQRHVMLGDDDVSDTRWSRCTLSAVLASVVGDGRVYVSTRAEHMGPLGGGPVAIIAQV